MQKDFFVMLNHQNGGIVPMTDKEGDLVTYDSEEDARQAANTTILGEAFGYEVFERGCGVA